MNKEIKNRRYSGWPSAHAFIRGVLNSLTEGEFAITCYIDTQNIWNIGFL